MSSIPSKAKDAVGTAINKTGDQTRQKFDEVKGKMTFGRLFKELLDNLRAGKGKETLKSLTALIAAVFGRKLATLKADVESSRKQKGETATVTDGEGGEEVAEEDRGEENESEENESEAVAKAESDEPLPDDLTGIPYNSANVLRCKDFNQCQALMKANGFFFDEGSKNYIDSKYLSPGKILNEPLITATIGTKEVRLKKSIMERLKRADENMFRETGEHIKVGEHFRSNEHQFGLFKDMRPKGGKVAKPGYSFHEIGQAVDLPLNWEKAQKYMWAEGFMGGKAPIGIKQDANHFSIGEIGMTDQRVAALEAEGVTPKGQALKKAA